MTNTPHFAPKTIDPTMNLAFRFLLFLGIPFFLVSFVIAKPIEQNELSSTFDLNLSMPSSFSFDDIDHSKPLFPKLIDPSHIQDIKDKHHQYFDDYSFTDDTMNHNHRISLDMTIPRLLVAQETTDDFENTVAELDELETLEDNELSSTEIEDEFEEFDGENSFDDFGGDFGGDEELVSDPLEGYNRFMTDVNDWLFLNVLDPVASGYAYVVPQGGRQSISNFFHNLLYPIRLINNLLQFKFKNATEETSRFIINSTVGLFGFFDPARKWGMQPHDEDFGQTLGYYGVGSGPHIVLPFLGPSNLRDMISLYPDSEIDYIKNEYVIGTERQIGLKFFEETNGVSLQLGQYQSFKEDALDWYSFLRNAYEQNRKKQIEE